LAVLNLAVAKAPIPAIARDRYQTVGSDYHIEPLEPTLATTFPTPPMQAAPADNGRSGPVRSA